MITIVTGIPRSGTSLMMQLFEAAEVSICSDAIRQHDENNPKGYYELEAVKGIVKSNSFLKDVDGKVIKIVAPLVQFIDLSLDYRVVFMLRDLDEVVQSQEKMVQKDQQDQKEKFKTMYALHIEKSRQFLKSHQIPFIEIQHRELVSNPKAVLPKLMEFCGWSVSIETLLAVVDPSLYRNRSDK